VLNSDETRLNKVQAVLKRKKEQDGNN